LFYKFCEIVIILTVTNFSIFILKLKMNCSPYQVGKLKIDY